MKIPKLVQPLLGAKITYLLIWSAFFLIAGSPVIAQNLTPQPVARLLGEVVDSSRLRRGNNSEGHAPGLAKSSATSPSLDEATAPERRAFKVTNEVRVKNGLTPLAWDPELCRMARTHSRNMATLGFFSHETPEGLRLRDRALATGILRFRVLAENIAYNQGYDDPGAFAVERWMISFSHRANILSREFQESAIGTFVTPDGKVYLTQVFITR